MHSLVALFALVAVASAATPFFESPHNPQASAFYKVPVNQEYHHQPSPVHRPPPSYNHEPAYQRPGPSYHQAGPSYHQAGPSYHQAGPSYHHSGPSYGGSSGYGHSGATSFQTVRLGGESSYGHGVYGHNSHY